MTYTIRRATPDDLEQIIGLFQRGFGPAVQPILIEEVQTSTREASSVRFVAVEDREVIGYARIHYIKPDKALFGALVVDEAQRNRGIATALSRARVGYLTDNNFQGLALSDAVTLHPYSQQQLFSVGFSPVRILPGNFPDHGSGPETSVGFAQIFSPVGLWRAEATTLSLYLPHEYRTIAEETLCSFGSVVFREASVETAGERTRSFVTGEEILYPKKLYPVRLYEPSAPADMKLLQEKGYIIAGFAPLIVDGSVSAVAYMYNVPDVALDKEKIKIIPTARRLFDFVWEQYESVR
ncbi:GNAT family N-acetyltransferase [Candidatus Woesearchaeota archaeon]|nr:GNAT family N-acetyltransferase [Candidatus Woesearchaeota archaeon]